MQKGLPLSALPHSTLDPSPSRGGRRKTRNPAFRVSLHELNFTLSTVSTTEESHG
jgi:hypothetical protein